MFEASSYREMFEASTSSLKIVTEPRWLDDTQQVAWRSLLAIANRALPEIERSLKAHGLLGVHYHIFVELSDAPARAESPPCYTLLRIRRNTVCAHG